MNICHLSVSGHRKSVQTSRGFTLLEVSIVLLIMGLLMGTVMRPMGADMEKRQRSETRQLLFEIREALIGYAAVHHRLPCPVGAGANQGSDDQVCTSGHGYVPAVTLGLVGHYDIDGLLSDSWGNPVTYHVSLSDADGDGLPDFTTAQEMRDVGMQALNPEYQVCASGECQLLRANNLPVVLVSTGGSVNASADELENTNADLTFVSRDMDQSGDDQFDDMVIWLSENILYTRLLQAHVLP